MKRRVYRASAMLALIAATAAIAIVLSENVLHAVLAQQADQWSDALRAIVSAIGGYLFGSIPFGFIIIGVLRERDITEEGSGRTGGTNALRAGGTLAFALTGVGDVLKGLAAVAFARIVCGESGLAMAITGLAAVVGHNWSIYLGFKGGAGTAPNIGVSMALWLPSGLYLIPLVFVGLGVIGYASVASILVATAVVMTFLIRAISGADPQWWYAAYSICAALTVLWALRPNIKRLLTGTEHRAPKLDSH